MGLRYGSTEDEGGNADVERVLARSVSDGLLDTRNMSMVVPACRAVRDLVVVSRQAMPLPEELMELVAYCVGSLRYVFEAAAEEPLPRSLHEILEGFATEVEAVESLCVTYATQNRCHCLSRGHQGYARDAVAKQKAELERYLDLVATDIGEGDSDGGEQPPVAVGGTLETIDEEGPLEASNEEGTLGASNNEGTLEASDEKKVSELPGDEQLSESEGEEYLSDVTDEEDIEEVPWMVPELPSTYVRRNVDDIVLRDLISADHSDHDAYVHCLWGVEGSGKTLLASSVISDRRTLARYDDGVFWLSVGGLQKDESAFCLEQLTQQFSEADSGRQLGPLSRWEGTTGSDQRLELAASDRMCTASDLARGRIIYLRHAREGRRCLVVLDGARDVEVVNMLASTGLHLLVTARDKSVLSSRWPGTCTEIGDMTPREAEMFLRRTSRLYATQLPPAEARTVRASPTRLATTSSVHSSPTVSHTLLPRRVSTVGDLC